MTKQQIMISISCSRRCRRFVKVSYFIKIWWYNECNVLKLNGYQFSIWLRPHFLIHQIRITVNGHPRPSKILHTRTHSFPSLFWRCIAPNCLLDSKTYYLSLFLSPSYLLTSYVSKKCNMKRVNNCIERGGQEFSIKNI